MNIDVELIEELGECEVPFGKYKGETVDSVYAMDPGYLRFIASKEGLNSVIFKIYLAAKGE